MHAQLRSGVPSLRQCKRMFILEGQPHSYQGNHVQDADKRVSLGSPYSAQALHRATLAASLALCLQAWKRLTLHPQKLTSKIEPQDHEVKVSLLV